MTRYDLPTEYSYEADGGGQIAGEFKRDALVITITDDVSREEAWIELTDAKIREFFEGFSALLLDDQAQVDVDVKDKDRDADAESIVLTANPGGVDVDLHLWGDASQVHEAGSMFSVWLSDAAAHTVYVAFNAMALRQGVAYR